MSKNFDIQEMTVKQICNYIAVVNRMVDEKIIKFNPNKASVIFNYDKASIFLEKQNIDLQQRINEAIKIIESYNLGKYDYSIPPGGIIDLLEILKGGNND